MSQCMPLIKKYLYYSLEANLIKYELILLKKFEDSLDEDTLFERKKLNWKEAVRKLNLLISLTRSASPSRRRP